MANGQAAGEDARIEVLREAWTMVLYLSIVLIATFIALPSGDAMGGDGHTSGGVHGGGLVALIWGTAIGLALAHLFAFRLTARAYGGGALSEKDIRIGLAQLGGAAFVAALCTVPVVVFDDADEVRAATVVPAALVGIAGYFVARSAERSRTQALILGVVMMVLGLAVAAVKNFLLGH